MPKRRERMPVNLSGRMDCVLRVSQLSKATRGSLRVEKAKVSSVRRLRHIFQKGGKLEGTELQAADEGPQCGDGSALWSPAEQVIQQKPTC